MGLLYLYILQLLPLHRLLILELFLTFVQRPPRHSYYMPSQNTKFLYDLRTTMRTPASKFSLFSYCIFTILAPSERLPSPYLTKVSHTMLTFWQRNLHLNFGKPCM